MRRQERFQYPRPPVRPLKIYAFDPMVGLDRRTRVSVDTRNEPLRTGPIGARIAVVDYDVSHHCFYTPVNLDEAAILMQGGIDHAEGDPRFHQQMVYAVASRIIEIFDRALGRPVELASKTSNGKPRPLRIFPHAFAGPNAFFNPELGAIVFGYFRATAEDSGANIPGQTIFSCLSHDVIAHELTHALIHRLSPTLPDSSHPDTLALHEGLADLVAILHRFSLESVIRDEVQRTRGALDVASTFCQVATQFGAGLGLVHGLRNARPAADPNQYATVMEAHDRGALLIAATLEALFRVYRAQVQDLFDLAGVTASSAGGDLHPDLVNRLATQISRAATSLLTMCIRAFDYLPPVDVSFGDFLRAVVTADWELAPDDPGGQRGALIESFRSRGIYATGARSLAEESLRWERPEKSPEPLPQSCVADLTRTAQAFGRIRPGEGEGSIASKATRKVNEELKDYARRNARTLHLWPLTRIKPPSARYSFRVGADGQLAVDIIVTFIQERPGRSSRPQYRGVTLVASADGSVRYLINNQPVPKFDPARAAPQVANGALRFPKPFHPATQPLFPARYRLTPAEYRRSFRALSLTRDEMKELERSVLESLG